MRKRPHHPDAIVPGHPEKSELVKRIESKDPHYLMPQAAEGEAKPMNSGDIAILKEWIREGAVYRPHWAFEIPQRPPVPTPRTSTAHGCVIDSAANIFVSDWNQTGRLTKLSRVKA
jgi:hypothetical protein